MTFTLTAEAFFQLGFYILLLIFVIHAVVFAYHWISFGANKTTSFGGIAIYLAGGATFILLLSVALNFI